MQDAERARSELHQNLEEAASRTLEEAEKNKKYQDIIIHENKELNSKITQQAGIILGKQEEIENLRHTANQKDREVNELKHLLADKDEIKRQNE